MSHNTIHFRGAVHDTDARAARGRMSEEPVPGAGCGGKKTSEHGRLARDWLPTPVGGNEPSNRILYLNVRAVIGVEACRGGVRISNAFAGGGQRELAL